VNIEQLRDELAPEGCLVALDVAKEHFVAAVCDDRGTVRKMIRWRHPEETPAFLELVKGLAPIGAKAVMESTGTYGDAIAHCLRGMGVPVFEVQTKHTHDARELFDGVPSQHDGKCAAIIGMLHAQGKSHPRRVDSAAQRAVRALLSSRTLYHEQLEMCRGRLEALLARYWPEASRIVGLDSAALLAVLSAYGSPQQVAANAEDAYALMVKTGGAKLCADKAAAVVRTAGTTLGVVPVAEEVQALQGLVEEMQRCKAAILALQKKLKKHCEAVPEAAAMARVVGALAALTLFGTLGSVGNYGSAGAWLKVAGMNLKERSSGRDPKSSKPAPVRLSKRGSPEVRRLLFLASLRLGSSEPLIAAWLKKKARRDGGSKMKGQVAVMRKLMRALWHIGSAAAAIPESSGEDRQRLERDAAFDAKRLFDPNLLSDALTQAAA